MICDRSEWGLNYRALRPSVAERERERERGERERERERREREERERERELRTLLLKD